MVRRNRQMITIFLFLVGGMSVDTAAQNSVSDAKAVEGLWQGTWGGGEAGGVTYQPVIAELFISGNHVELSGIRNAERLLGTVRFDTRGKQMVITPEAPLDNRPQANAIRFTYEIKDDKLTLVDREKLSISLDRVNVSEEPLGNAKVELIQAAGINDAGDLIVTRFNVLKAGRTGVAFHQLENRSLSISKATVRIVTESGWENVTVNEARARITKSTPVVVAYRNDVRASRNQKHTLWKEMGSPAPDSEEVWRTFSRILRPGTLVFILPAKEKILRP